MIQLNKINSSYYGKINTQIGRYFNLNSDYINKKFMDTEIVDINTINTLIKENTKDRMNDTKRKNKK